MNDAVGSFVIIRLGPVCDRPPGLCRFLAAFVALSQNVAAANCSEQATADQIVQASRELDLPCRQCLSGYCQQPNVVRAHRINSAIVTCLEHVATSTAPPGAGAADFLLKLLDDGMFTIDEVDQITRRVSIILRGITERHELIDSPVAVEDEPIPPPVIVAAPVLEPD